MQQLAQSPSQPASPIPYGLVSLWDMISEYGYQIIRAIEDLAELENFHLTGLHDSSTHNGLIIACIGTLADTLQLSSSKIQIQTVMRESIRGASPDKLLTEVRQLRRRLEEDSRSRYFFFVTPGQETYYVDRPFGNLTGIFQDSYEDIKQAGHCIALDRHAAVVFHLMRAMEMILQKIGITFGVSNVDKDWGKILSDLDSRIKMLPKGETKAAWLAAHTNLYNIKEAWRNPTMHPKRTYNKQEAMDVFQSVSAFSRHLSQLVDVHGLLP